MNCGRKNSKSEESAKRRGVAGIVYAYKCAGAKAEEGADLTEVTRVAQKTADRCRSIGMALSSCTVPAAGKPTFDIGNNEMEMGMGIHGEPGIWRDSLKSADDLSDEMMERILSDQPITTGERVSVLVNSLGATPHEELYIMYRRVKIALENVGAIIVMPLIGRYATSMEMVGASITVCKLDDELEKLLQAPADCPFWSVNN